MILDVKPLGQRDSKWKDQRLGTVEGTTIGSDGCVITAASMLLTFHGHPILPSELNDTLTNKGLYHNGNLFVDSSLHTLYNDIASDGIVFCENDPAPLDKIKSYLSQNNPVFVWLINQGVRHSTLAVGWEDNQIIVNDPWQGDQVKISDRWGDSATVIIQVNFFSGPTPKTSGDPLASCMADREKFWKERDEALRNLDLAQGDIKQKEDTIKNLNNQLSDLKNKLTTKDGELSNIKTQLLNEQTAKESAQNQADSSNNYQALYTQLKQDYDKDKIGWSAQAAKDKQQISSLQGRIETMKPKGLINKLIFLFS